MARKKMDMPSGAGGLVRYYDEDASAVRIDPKWVLGAVGFLVLLEIFLHTYGTGLISSIA